MRTLRVVVPTYNRAALLERALRSLTDQAPVSVSVDIVVVDNNSTDDTRRVVEAFNDWVRYIREPIQGLSHARNRGIHEPPRARLDPDPDFVAFTDDDVEVAQDWLSVIVREFDEHPEMDCAGGRVLPQWTTTRPDWLTPAHWGPLGLQDHGDTPREFDAANPLCLIGANVAFRRSVFDRIGVFCPEVQRVKDGIGSTEDHELLLRLYGAGGRARYVPDLIVHTEVPEDRLTPGYHRRWHRGHGRFYAVMRTQEVERSNYGLILGVPAHLYRTAAGDLKSWLALRLKGERAEAFAREARLWFFSGFLRERYLCPPRR